MPYAFAFYPDPPTARVTITPDSGGAYSSVPYTDPATGRGGQVCYVNEGTPDQQGASLDIAADGYNGDHSRGFLVLDNDAMIARFQLDDRQLTPSNAAPTPTPPPSGPVNPLDVINRVYGETHPQLWTLEGCGTFTEDCCTALHNESSPYWGHVEKDPGQNQYHGHAVDAIMLALDIPGTGAGIYDIIFSSVSSEAKPCFNFAGPPEFDKWIYPAPDANDLAVPAFALRLVPRRHR